MRDEAVRTLRTRFPNVPFRYEAGGSVIAHLEAPNPALGTLTIEEAGDELTVHIGEFTHGHFNRFDLDGDAANRAVAGALGDFLEDLFSDRIVIWRAAFTGGWFTLEDAQYPMPHGKDESHVWTRALDTR